MPDLLPPDGAPSHRLEGQLESTARVLEIDAHFFYLPSNLIMSFSKPDSGSDTAFLRAAGALDTEKLKQVHAVVSVVFSFRPLGRRWADRKGGALVPGGVA